MKWNTTRTSSIIRLSSNINCYSTPTIPPSISRSNYYTSYRPKSKHLILRPSRRRGSSSISTSILILRTPRSIYFNSTRIRSYFTHCCTQHCKIRTIRNTRYNLRYNWNFYCRIHCMSTSHVHSWIRCRYTSLFHSCNNNYCCTNRN